MKELNPNEDICPTLVEIINPITGPINYSKRLRNVEAIREEKGIEPIFRMSEHGEFMGFGCVAGFYLLGAGFGIYRLIEYLLE